MSQEEYVTNDLTQKNEVGSSSYKLPLTSMNGKEFLHKHNLIPILITVLTFVISLLQTQTTNQQSALSTLTREQTLQNRVTQLEAEIDTRKECLPIGDVKGISIQISPVASPSPTLRVAPPVRVVPTQ